MLLVKYNTVYHSICYISLLPPCLRVNVTDKNTQTNIYIFLPCLQVLFSHKVHRHTAQMFSGTLPLSRVHPRTKPTALPRWIRVFLGCERCGAARRNKRWYRTHYNPWYYVQWVDADSKLMPRYIFDVCSTPSTRTVSDTKDKRICQ